MSDVPRSNMPSERTPTSDGCGLESPHPSAGSTWGLVALLRHFPLRHFPLLQLTLLHLILLRLISLLFASSLALPQTVFAEDPLSSVLQSKVLKERGGSKRSRLKYPLRPWFSANSNLEKLFSDAAFADNLTEWLLAGDINYQVGEPRKSFDKTHIHVDTIVLDRKRQSMFQLTILVPHPAFLTIVEGNVIEDFAKRQPPLLKVSSSEDLEVGGAKWKKYYLKSERCSGLLRLKQGALIEIRSVEPCGTNSGLTELANRLDTTLFEQKLAT
ncbi:MAG: hypothetical protein EBZ48_01915 [Proteobacteria bacterium]|nr:hypothetical protein [Pseudomonadota bacterium]